jgi:hypothetical protein
MFKLLFISILILIFINQGVKAQDHNPASGKVEIVQDAKITQLTEQYRKMSLNNSEIDGFRVQIFFDSGSNSKNKASNVKGEFDSNYPGINSYLSYKEPYYRVRVGNFHNLIEAVGFQKKIQADYPNAFPVKDKIVE